MSEADIRRAILELAGALALAFLAVALWLGFLGVVRGPRLSRRYDNSRRQAFEQRIARGRILDRAGVVLAESTADGAGGVARRYAYPAFAPVVGYQAWRYGAGADSGYGLGGAEAAYDAALRGDVGLSLRQYAAGRVLHRPQEGRDVRLTIDASLQAAAVEALAGREGAVVILDVPTGAVRALASLPTYDAARLDALPPAADDPSSPFLSRATQGLYPPGSTFKLVTLAAALEAGVADLGDRLEDGDRSERFGGVEVACGNNPPGMVSFDLQAAFGWSCNLTFARLATRLGDARWRRAAAAFGIEEAPPFPLPAAAGSLSREAPMSEAVLASAGFGQGEVLVTPLHMALVAAAVAGDGAVPSPNLLADVPGVRWRSMADEVGTWRRAVSPATAARLRRAMTASGSAGWARAATEAAGRPVAGKTGTAETGPGQATHAWFIGFAPPEDPRLAIAVLIVGGGDGAAVAAPVGGRLLGVGLDGVTGTTTSE